MKKILRSAVLVAGLATTMIMGSTSAHAAGAGVFTADVLLDGFGNGESDGEAWLCVNGTVNGALVVNAAACTSVTGHAGSNAHATFTLNEDAATCPATGTAIGEVTGAVTTDFQWTRVGAVAVITVSGGTLGTGGGVAAFAVTSPLGNPCHVTGPVGATAVGLVAGA